MKVKNLYLYGEIGEKKSVDPIKMIETIKELEQTHDKINLYINSPGGEVFSGFSLFTALRNSPLTIDVYIEGLAASIASAIACVGNMVYISKFAMIMVHKPYAIVLGDNDKLSGTVDLLRNIENSLIEIYHEKTKISKEVIKNEWLKSGSDKYFTAQEAIKIGLANSLYEGQIKQRPKTINNLADVWNVYNALSVPGEYDPNFGNKVETFEHYHKNDPKMLAYLKEHEPEKYIKLYKNHFGLNPTNVGQKPILNLTTEREKLIAEIENNYKNWTIEDFQKKSPNVLQRLKQFAPEQYRKLFKNYYGVEPQNT